jgi:hypothetical protein
MGIVSIKIALVIFNKNTFLRNQNQPQYILSIFVEFSWGLPPLNGVMLFVWPEASTKD